MTFTTSATLYFMRNEDYKILFVEDEPALREIMVELLRDEGFQCVAVANGLEASEKLSQERYDLLITDFQMPLMNGAQLLFWCREHDLHLPVIFVSANTDRLPIEEMALNDCCASMLTKPVAFEVLLDSIGKARSRAHEFDCQGETFPQHMRDRDHFPGQHISR